MDVANNNRTNNRSSSTSTSASSGYLEIILGSMYSGKTTYLLDLYKKYVFCHMPIVVINYADDVRYSDSMLSSHDKNMIPCIRSNTISDAYKTHFQEINAADVILINEGQFFADIEEYVHIFVERLCKRVYICGLDGDFERKPIGKLLQLIPFCDEVIKLKSLCSICRNGTPGIFSFRITNEIEQFVIGASNYMPLCRTCYNDESAKRTYTDM